MSVFKRKTTAGQTAEYHYRFMKAGKRYSGVCINCTSIEEARSYEKQIIETVGVLAQQKNVKALVENFKVELCGDDRIEIKDSWEKFLQKPTRRIPTQGYLQKKQKRWQTFVDFMAQNFPDVRYIHEVTRVHAEKYIFHLRTLAKASSTVNAYHKCAQELFKRLNNSGLENPFSAVQLLLEKQEPREAFTHQELELILSIAPQFIRAIFIVGFFTAFREGDISTLRWSEVLWEHGIIRRELIKTGVIVEVPIMQPLAEFLREQIGKDSEYVLPEHADMYINNPSGITYRVKKFLEQDCHIVTTKKVAGRTKAVSIKDVHSLRHTFCYFAGVAGIPLVVVQSIVGHMTKEMTAHYTAHADRKTKREKLTALPIFKALIDSTSRIELEEQTRLKVIESVKKADSATLSKIAAILLPVKPKRSLLHSEEQEISTL